MILICDTYVRFPITFSSHLTHKLHEMLICDFANFIKQLYYHVKIATLSVKGLVF